jgi:hypothetical protein
VIIVVAEARVQNPTVRQFGCTRSRVAKSTYHREGNLPGHNVVTRIAGEVSRLDAVYKEPTLFLPRERVDRRELCSYVQ